MTSMFAWHRSRGVRVRTAAALAAAGALAMSSGLVLLAPASSAHGDQALPQGYYFCHALGSGGYNSPSASSPGVVFGHYGSSHQDGRDVIPPFVHEGQTYAQNWDTAGRAIWRNGCAVPPPPTDQCQDLPGNQPEGFPCTKQEVTGADSSEGEPSCDTFTVDLLSTPWTQQWVFTPDENGGSWALGAKQYGDTVTTGTRAATALECPAPSPPPPPPPPPPPSSPSSSAAVDLCDNLAGDQAVVPEGFEATGDGQCAGVLGTETVRPTPTPTPTPAPASAPASTPTSTLVPTEHAQPVRPHEEPTVLGAEAVAPTAVEAGLATWPTEAPEPPGPRLGTGLVGTGLLLLTAAGRLGATRRTRGAHEG